MNFISFSFSCIFTCYSSIIPTLLFKQLYFSSFFCNSFTRIFLTVHLIDMFLMTVRELLFPFFNFCSYRPPSQTNSPVHSTFFPLFLFSFFQKTRDTFCTSNQPYWKEEINGKSTLLPTVPSWELLLDVLHYSITFLYFLLPSYPPSPTTLLYMHIFTVIIV